MKTHTFTCRIPRELSDRLFAHLVERHGRMGLKSRFIAEAITEKLDREQWSPSPMPKADHILAILALIEANRKQHVTYSLVARDNEQNEAADEVRRLLKEKIGGAQ